MSVVIIYRLRRFRRIVDRFRRNKLFFVALFFLATFVFNSVMFYYTEHVLAGREDVDIYTAMYWSIITMATIGYGDVTPSRGPGWLLAGVAAIMGIAVYTLTVSVIADAFLTHSLKKTMGLAPLKRKKIIVIGDTDSCKELVQELIANNLGDYVGWVMSRQPKGDVGVDYVVGDFGDTETLKRAGVDKAEHVALCIGDDSKTIHTLLLVRRLNKKAQVSALASTGVAEELLEEAGATRVLSARFLGRTLASSIFEPSVVDFVKEVTTARGIGDLRELEVDQSLAGKTVGEAEEVIRGMYPGYTATIVGVKRGGELALVPSRDLRLREHDRLILLLSNKTRL